MRDAKGYECVPVDKPASAAFEGTLLEGLSETYDAVLEGQSETYDAVRGISGKLVPFTIDETSDEDLLTDLANICFKRARGPNVTEKLLSFADQWGLLTSHHEMRLEEIIDAITEIQCLMMVQDAASRGAALQRSMAKRGVGPMSLRPGRMGVSLFLRPNTLLTYCQAKMLLLTNSGNHIGRCKICDDFFIGERGQQREYCRRSACRSKASKAGLTGKGDQPTSDAASKPKRWQRAG